MRKAVALALVVLVALVIVQCTSDQEVVVPVIPPSQCDTAMVTYENYVKQVMDTKCALSGCHAGSVSPDLRTYAGIKGIADNGKLKLRAFDHNPGPMPPNPFPALSQPTQDSLQDWMDQGTCENNN